MSNIDEKEYQEFLEKHEKGHYAQSLEWAKIKDDWKNEIIILRDEKGKIKASLSLLIRKLPYINSSLMYAPRGPVCDIDDEESFKQLIAEADKLAKKYKAFMLKIDPDILASNQNFKNTAKKCGFKVEEKIKNVNNLLQPRYVFRLDLKGKTEDEVFASFHSKTRYNIRLAGKKGVTLREGTRDDLQQFQDILETTGERDGFFIRKKEYFEKIYDSFDKEHLKLVFADYEGKPIACVLNIFYGNKEWYLYGGSLNEHRNLMSTYLLQWEMIKEAIARGMDCYDFRGVCASSETDYNEGLYRFKKGFNADFVEFMDMHKVYKKTIYFLFETCAYKLRDFKLKISGMLKK